MKVGGKEYTAEEVMASAELVRAMVAEKHAERYPQGCRTEGHHCFDCLARLMQRPHKFTSRRIGAREFYKGTVEIRCLDCREEP